MRLKGHGLRHEGRVWGPDARLHNGVGHARCECGGRSPELPTTAARQRWHKTHKALIASQQRDEEAGMDWREAQSW